MHTTMINFLQLLLGEKYMLRTKSTPKRFYLMLMRMGDELCTNILLRINFHICFT